MDRIKLTCEVITPMFMAGADGKTPEIRPSEFKGMMRFWWRAAKAEDDIDRLRKEEAEIFGGTGEKEGRSKVQLKILSSYLKTEDDIRRELNDKDDGIKYLLYSTFVLRASGEPIIRKYIKIGSKFEISLESSYKHSFENALASLWLSIYLGGFGTRARRGSGNISIQKISSNNSMFGLNFICPARDKNKLKQWIESNLEVIKQIISQGSTSKYSNLSGGRILIFDSKINWKEALNFIAEKFKNFRSSNKSKLWDIAAFGMPVMHKRFSLRMVPYSRGRRLSDRLASPLIIKVIKSNNLFFPVLVKLNYGIGEVGKEIKKDRDWGLENRNDIRTVDQKLIDNFLDSFKNQAVEVRL